MNFFAEQDRAKSNTTKLVLLLLAAVITLIALTVVLVAVSFGVIDSSDGVKHMSAGGLPELLNLSTILSIAATVSAIVLLGSAYRWVQLKRGGASVAESLGGRLINSNTRDEHERRALNVVEEMAIASGTPVPLVYIIEEPGINAFAAGLSPQDAVIGLTKGCVQQLNREELQGVVAHEFSHIFHGDMTLNMRLIGLLHGILVIGLIGGLLVRSGAYRAGYSRSKNNNRSGLFFFGLGLMAIGYGGTFFGNIIKSAVSRQREFLADASAVQFTRNPDGIAGALKTIGGASAGSQIAHNNASEFSHMFFSSGVSTWFNGLMATHPPLPDRIRKIDPRWSGEYPRVDATQPSSTTDSEHASAFASGTDSSSDGGFNGNTGNTTSHQSLDEAVDSIGDISHAHINHAQQLLQQIPAIIREAAHNSFSARALIHGLIIIQTKEAGDSQWQHLHSHAETAVIDDIKRHLPALQQLPRTGYLPLIELCMPALRELSPQQYDRFKRNLAALIKADRHVSLFEWSLYGIITHHLSKTSPTGSQSLFALAASVSPLLAAIIKTAHTTNSESHKLAQLNSALKRLQLAQVTEWPNTSLTELDKCIQNLRQLKPLQKPSLLKSMANCIQHDGIVTAQEAELFRAIAERLDCPVPPIMSNTQ